MRCKVKYRVHIIWGWLDYVYNNDWSDYINRYSRNGKNIDLFEVNFIYYDLNPKWEMRLVRFIVFLINKNYYDC